MKIISCMIPEIWSTTDRIFSHFWPFFALLQPPPLPLPNKAEKQNFEKTPGDIIILHKCTISDNHMIYGSRDMKCTRQNFLSSCPIFYPFTPLTAWKMKCTKKQSVPKIMTIGYTVPQIWHMTNAIVIFHFGLWKFQKNEKNVWRYHHKCTKNHDHKLYCSWDMAYDGCNRYFSFGANILPFYPLTAQKIKKKFKNEKNT